MKKCWTCLTEKNEDEFYVSKRHPERVQRRCKVCVLESNRRWARHKYAQDKKDTKRRNLIERERQKAYAREWSAKNPDKARERSQRWRERNPGYRYKVHLRKAYGLSWDEYMAMHTSQMGMCAICKGPQTSTYKGRIRWLSVDHDHKAGKVRGLLCFHCNAGLGHFLDDAARVRSALSYLEAHHVSGQ